MAAAVRNARLHEQAQAEAAARARAEATAAAREQAARVLEAVGDGVMMVDGDGKLRFWNRAAELSPVVARDDVVGRAAGEVLDDWDAVAAEIPISEEAELARPVTLPVEVDGERALALVRRRPQLRTAIVYTFRDLTVDRGLEAAKSDFIATLSHELRTPMTAVLGAAKTLLRDDIALSPERRHQLLEMIGAQGTRLTQITEEVLLANRLDRGDLRIDSERVDLAQLVEHALETMRQDAPESISLTAEGNGRRGARRPRPDRAGARQPDRQRCQVLARWRRGRRPHGARRGQRARRGRRPGNRHPARPSKKPSSRSSTAATRSTARCPAAPASASTSAASWCSGWAARSASAPAPARARPSGSTCRGRDVRCPRSKMRTRC